MDYKLAGISYDIQATGCYTGCPVVQIIFSGVDVYGKNHKQNFLMKYPEILKFVKLHGCNFVILTGGEPTDQDIKSLIKALLKKKYYVVLETNGLKLIKDTEPKDYKNQECNFIPDWIIVVPNENDNLIVNIEPTEIRLIVGKNFTDKYLEKFLQCQYCYLEPESPQFMYKAKQIVKANPGIRLAIPMKGLLK